MPSSPLVVGSMELRLSAVRRSRLLLPPLLLQCFVAVIGCRSSGGSSMAGSEASSPAAAGVSSHGAVFGLLQHRLRAFLLQRLWKPPPIPNPTAPSAAAGKSVPKSRSGSRFTVGLGLVVASSAPSSGSSRNYTTTIDCTVDFAATAAAAAVSVAAAAVDAASAAADAARVFDADVHKLIHFIFGEIQCWVPLCHPPSMRRQRNCGMYYCDDYLRPAAHDSILEQHKNLSWTPANAARLVPWFFVSPRWFWHCQSAALRCLSTISNSTDGEY